MRGAKPPLPQISLHGVVLSYEKHRDNFIFYLVPFPRIRSDSLREIMMAGIQLEFIMWHLENNIKKHCISATFQPTDSYYLTTLFQMQSLYSVE
jgi:hypothetical protein